MLVKVLMLLWVVAVFILLAKQPPLFSLSGTSTAAAAAGDKDNKVSRASRYKDTSNRVSKACRCKDTSNKVSNAK